MLLPVFAAWQNVHAWLHDPHIPSVLTNVLGAGTFVQPFVFPFSVVSSSPIRYSGITPQLLDKVDTRLPQVQATLLRVVGAKDILVGHSLENDLKALKMVHLRCLDTSLLYPHPKKGRRSSLRYLVSMYVLF